MRKYLLYFFVPFGLMACKESEEWSVDENPDRIEISEIVASIDGGTKTRAEGIADYVGRDVFVGNDHMKLTKLFRTDHALNDYNYAGLEYNYTIEAGQVDGNWRRDTDKGSTTSSPVAPENIYWTDGSRSHTFVGYCTPQPPSGKTFDWTHAGEVYYGSIGDPYAEGFIDHTDNTKIKYDDILVTHDTEMQAESGIGGGSRAVLKFHHALANVRVIVTITGFSSTTADTKSIVEDMVLGDMLTLYKWDQQSNGVQSLNESDPYATIWPTVDGKMVAYNQTKDTHMWIPRPSGVGTGSAKTFTFYALAVPCVKEDQKFTFTVKYPDPMNPTKEVDGQTVDNLIENGYSATLSGNVEFKAGYCTTIYISLNHSNESMTLGAEYMSWLYMENPNDGSLRKNWTFLHSTDRTDVTISSDKKATEDDATWLYMQEGVLYDIYKHTGTATDPYQISTADQLLSFAYEVQNGNSFTGKYVKLDADITLQDTTLLKTEELQKLGRSTSGSKEALKWIGIGSEGKVFNGTFLGGGRKISRVNDAPLFYALGADAFVEHLNIIDPIIIAGTGALTANNAGIVEGCMVDGDMKSTVSGAGSLIGTNTGTVIACYHVGDMDGKGNVSGLVGTNSGSIIGCYNAGAIKGTTVYGIANGGTMTGCFNNNDLAKVVASNSGEGKSTNEMQREAFIYDLNSCFDSRSKYAFEYNPASYPSLVPYVEDNAVLKNGFYRVQNVGSERYVYITDNKGRIVGTGTNHDLDAIELHNVSSAMYSDPGSVIYVKRIQGSEYNLLSQGTSVNDVIKHLATITRNSEGSYKVGATYGNLERLIGDEIPKGELERGKVVTTASGNNVYWRAIPLGAENYFSVKPTVTATSDNFAPFYADFGFAVPTGMEVFYVSEIDSENKVHLKKLTGIIPNKTPIVIKCKSGNTSENKLDLKYSVSTVSGNLLKGNMFSNPGILVDGVLKHENRTATTANMRILAVDNDILVFKKPAISTVETPVYLPANQSYLMVPDSAPDIMTVVFDE